jgi:hypothetical protein
MWARVAKAYRRIRYGEPVVVVSGLPRSGTSMAMQMLEAGGLPVLTDGVRQASEDNPKGYYEYEPVKDLHRESDRAWVRGARGKAVKIISYLLKDLPPTNNYRVIFMERDLVEILASQLKMLERRGETNESADERMLELYRDHLWKVKYLLKHRPQFETFELAYKDVVEKPREQARRLQAFLGAPLDVESMASAVDEGLYRNRGNPG